MPSPGEPLSTSVLKGQRTEFLRGLFTHLDAGNFRGPMAHSLAASWPDALPLPLSPGVVKLHVWSSEA